MPKKRYDPAGNELPPYIYYNKRARKYDARAYIDGKEVQVGRRFFSKLDRAITEQQKFISEQAEKK